MAEYKVVNATQLDADMESLADSIRAKAGLSEKLAFPAEMKAAVDGIPGTENEDAIVQGTITDYENDRVTSVGARLFYAHDGIKSVTCRNVTHIGDRAFSECANFAEANFPKLETLGEYVFYYSPSLVTANFPDLKTTGSYPFQDCAGLTTVNCPNLTDIVLGAFRRCYALVTADFSAVTSIGNMAFSGCSELKALILRSYAIVTLNSTNAVSSSGIGEGTGYVYVPAAVVDDYKTATNWSEYASQIRALEDYTVDGTITSALDPNKI